jgi:hypothetical protein
MNDNPICCGKKMIKRDTDRMLTTYPPKVIWVWWCGNCGSSKEGGAWAVVGLGDDYWKCQWEKENQ